MLRDSYAVQYSRGSAVGDRQLRLVEKLPAFAEPWNEYTLEEARREFPPPTHPICGVLQTPVEDVRGRGGVGVGKGSGRTRRPLATTRSLPRDAMLLWPFQVAKPCPQADALRWLRQSQKGEVHESVDLRNLVGDTTILGWPACSDGPWRRRGGALTRPMLFLLFGSLFSSVEHNAKMTTFLQSHSLPLTAKYSAIEERAQCAILPSYVILSNPGSGPA